MANRDQPYGWTTPPPARRDEDRDPPGYYAPGTGGIGDARVGGSYYGAVGQWGQGDYGRGGATPHAGAGQGGYGGFPSGAYGTHRLYGEDGPTRHRSSLGEQSGNFGFGFALEQGDALPREVDLDPLAAGVADLEPHDEYALYRAWRDEQMRQLDRDYTDYRHERGAADFEEWRRNRDR